MSKNGLWVVLFIIFCSTSLVLAQDSENTLSEIFISPKGDFILRYPSDWRVLQSQDSVVSFRRAPDERFTIGFVAGHTLEASVSLSDMLDNMTGEGAVVQEPIRRFISNGNLAATAMVTYADEPLATNDVFTVTLNGMAFRSVLYAPVETRDELVEIVVAMLASLQAPRHHPAGTISTSDNPALPQRFTSEDGALSFDFPADWHVLEWIDEENQFTRIYLYGMSSTAGLVELSVDMSEDTNVSLVDYLNVGGLSSPFATESLTGLPLNGYPLVRYQVDDPLIPFQSGLHLGMDRGGAYVQLEAQPQALADPAIEPLMMDILSSISLNQLPPAAPRRGFRLEDRVMQVDLPQRYESEDGQLSFAYPAGWRVHQNEDDLVLISSDDFYLLGAFPMQGDSVRRVLLDYQRSNGEQSTRANSPQQFLFGDRLAGYTLVDAPNQPLNILYATKSQGMLIYINANFEARDPETETTLLAILVSAEAAAPPAGGTMTRTDDPDFPLLYTSANNALSFRLPSGWDVMERQQAEDIDFMLLPPESAAPAEPIAFYYSTGVRQSLQDVAMLGYSDVLYDSFETTHFQTNGHKGIRVDMQNEAITYLQTLNLGIDLEDGRMLMVRIGGAELGQYDWESLFMDLFASVELPDGTAPTSPAAPESGADCTLSAPGNVNLRGGPGTQFGIAGTLAAGTASQATGQTTGSDGFVWWQLTSGYWVRADVVNEAGNCDGLPAVP